MTPTLLSRTVAALKAIQTKVSRQRAKALLQLGNWQQKLRAEAADAKANADMEQGVEAEKEQKAEELLFSSTFTEAVWKLDEDFRGKMSRSMQNKAELVEMIRDSRAQQLRTLKNLIDLLQGKYSVGPTPPTEDVQAAAALADAFVQLRSNVHLPRVSNLQFEIETALRKKKDTHSILLRVRDMLDRSTPVDAGSVQGVAVQMGTALRELNQEQTKEGDARVRCDSQHMRAREESRGLRANLALMGAVYNNTQQAIAAAKGNLKGIAAKTHALEKLASDFAKMVAQAMRTLEGQSQDRGTIMVAVQKAGESAASLAEKSASTALMEQMLQQLGAQEQQESSYRSEQAAFRTHFLTYVRDYLQLLKERRGHYESSMSALELYSNEVANDAAVQHGSLEASRDLEREDKELCDSILRFYDRHNQRRQELKQALQARVLLEMSMILRTCACPNVCSYPARCRRYRAACVGPRRAACVVANGPGGQAYVGADT
ncbi:unnamed protein product [Prorocentrum cordatum]|uniref:Uncharacterized protein n=1 Tax=Prorocentrum cordatum TaxID=2364126 RepID=A0ABN9R9F1_9DINO|nr:unnamed protein product [Polarella glacialis]